MDGNDQGVAGDAGTPGAVIITWYFV
jgi:hypothetical protein